jgi:GDSL-like lipase/acylhydrolase family protein
MSHLVLLGDSIFDNASYTGGQPAVIDHVRRVLGDDWQSTLLAVDGSTTADVPAQLAKLPADASHLVVSAGGNDAILQSGILGEQVSSVAEALGVIALARQTFEDSYFTMLETCLGLGKPTTICTIYYPAFSDPAYQMVTVAGLHAFNDVIVRAAHTRKLPLIDLRLVCTEPDDYANEIEPSSKGAAKIARAIQLALSRGNFDGSHTTVFY